MIQRNTLFMPLVALALHLAANSNAFASDTCKNVQITIKNTTSDQVKVKKFEYYDYDKNDWNTENMFGFDGFQKLEEDKGLMWTRDLQHIGGDKTKFRVTYAHLIGGTKYAPDQMITTSDFTCRDGMGESVLLAK